MRLILDTNICSPRFCLLWARQKFTLVARDVLIAELRDVVGRPFSGRDFAPTRPSCSPRAFGTSPFFAGICPPAPSRRDPKDSYLLALAEASQAEFLVTGDKELLSLKQHRSNRIVTPAAMIEILKKS